MVGHAWELKQRPASQDVLCHYEALLGGWLQDLEVTVKSSTTGHFFKDHWALLYEGGILVRPLPLWVPTPHALQPLSACKRTKAEPAAEPTKGKGKAAKAKPAPQPGRWLDRDCNAALSMQRIGESRWRPLELCYWPGQGALPAKGKEYPGLGYKRLRDKPPQAQQQQQPADAQ
ncbi:hypothetical protein QJQ45_006133 [Haematococcus lacustris]|nr:hypothetical protein QJQ45_005961 [Haematococcus lacustris]KAJ9513555.1 hypothetical protein QJQ45_006133 [Haematococcus lacustris]